MGLVMLPAIEVATELDGGVHGDAAGLRGKGDSLRFKGF
jgi:hypothetical protein